MNPSTPQRQADVLLATHSYGFYVGRLTCLAVGQTFKIFSNDAPPHQCKASVLHAPLKSGVLCCTSDIAELGPTLSVYGFDAIWAKSETYHLHPMPSIRVTPLSWVQKVVQTVTDLKSPT